MDALVSLVVYIIVIGCIIGLLLYLVSIAPIPEPFKTWAWFLVMAFAVLAIIYVLLGMIGGGAPHVSLPNMGR